MATSLPKTPAGDSLEQIAQAFQSNPRMRRAIAAVLKAMSRQPGKTG